MAHTGGRMSYGDASIIKGLNSASHCYFFFNLQLLKLFTYRIYRDKFYFAGRVHLSLRDMASQQFWLCLQMLRYSHGSVFQPRMLPAYPRCLTCL